MIKNCCLIIFIFCSVNALAQTNVLTKADKYIIQQFKILKDSNYSFERIISDNTLPFTINPLLYNFKTNNYYWVKFSLKNPFNFPQEYNLNVFPFIDNTFYFYDSEEKKWQTTRAGLANCIGKRRHDFPPVLIYNNQINDYYVKINVSALANFKDSTHVRLGFKKTAIVQQDEQKMFLIWIATLIIIFILFLYNLYTYFIFKDKAFLYYLLILLGGIIYITAINSFFNLLFPFRYFQVILSKEGYTYFFDINSGLAQVGILLVLIGFIHFTRNYLQTKTILPKWDRALKCIAWVFAAMSIFTTVTTITGLWYSFQYFVLFSNISVVAIILTIFAVGIAACKQKYVFGKYFLIANTLPLLLVLLVAMYYIFNQNANDNGMLLPNMAILSQAFTFAIALSARISILKNDLGNEQLQAQLLSTNLLKAEQRNTEKEFHLKEIHHRVKNNLQIINGLLFMQFKDSGDAEIQSQLKQSQQRIKSMALVHNKLYESDDTVHIYIKEYIKDLAVDILKTNTPPGKAIQLNIQEDEAVNLSLNTSISLGLILNELITNACKYAFNNQQHGQIDISVIRQQNNYQLIIKDDGSGLAKDFDQKKSMGMRLVTNLSKQLGGTAKFESDNGTVVTINFVDTVAA